jgi:hypothetical protein
LAERRRSGTHNVAAQPYRKNAAQAFSAALSAYLTSVRLDQALDQGKSKSETTVFTVG